MTAASVAEGAIMMRRLRLISKRNQSLSEVDDQLEIKVGKGEGVCLKKRCAL